MTDAPKLTPKDQDGLAVKWQTQIDERAATELWSSVRPLMVFILNKYNIPSSWRDELLESIPASFTKSLNRWDSKRKVRFNSYCATVFTNDILTYIQNATRPKRKRFLIYLDDATQSEFSETDISFHEVHPDRTTLQPDQAAMLSDEMESKTIQHKSNEWWKEYKAHRRAIRTGEKPDECFRPAPTTRKAIPFRPFPGEEWRYLPGTDYKVSTFGRVSRGNHILKPWIQKGKRRMVQINQGGHGKQVYVDEMVWFVFMGEKVKGKMLERIDGKASNHCLSNLRKKSLEKKRDCLSAPRIKSHDKKDSVDAEGGKCAV